MQGTVAVTREEMPRREMAGQRSGRAMADEDGTVGGWEDGGWWMAEQRL